MRKTAKQPRLRLTTSTSSLHPPCTHSGWKAHGETTPNALPCSPTSSRGELRCRSLDAELFWLGRLHREMVSGRSNLCDGPPSWLLVALSGHDWRSNECPLSGEKRTSIGRASMSANDPKQTSGCARF